ncbi:MULTISPECIES: GTPase Era [unclassified Limnobacter]|jgi:GTPase|uniref:GTPase Era n=2 Tax=Burkholderiaceae TaxID=119060 RepID=UPI000C3A9AE8|nr:MULTISPECIES: GTPase Era [unclassified Limnobacter]MAG80335.1 GTPase Era [Sutterellaceae bacterium]PZO14688.1 MAG: GTPase Era [Betaproteobacteria bacterium]MBT85509.1 GTPase Era [Sutterellaceae bacterium]MDP3270688.1 GTPase Era [Limnobacter sp.]MDZ4049619.1 GTPase Era [Limnobacter sp.]|tara:strand:- start:119 stop:1015 length:897 start_codon:yes stop_codon:yes gene_type:complete
MAESKCGVIAVVGRPNVGKSTLMNGMIGEHLSITSSKPQTTRHRVLGVMTETIKDVPTQFIFVDTPGFQTKHSNALNKTMNRAVLTALADVNVILWVIEQGKLTPADMKVLELCPKGVPLVAVVNKVDLLEKKAEMLPFLQKVSGQRNFDAIVPLSAQAIKNLDALKEAVSALLPEQPFFYDEDTLTDRPEKFLAAERIREKLFRLVGDELPYTCTVVIDKFEIEEGRRVIYASILVDRSSHKAMIIGKGGEKLKRIGSEARQDMERLFGGSVHLETWVKVRSGWADNATLLQSLGYE